MFKKIAALSLMTAFAGGAYAVDGTVTITGAISAATCTVTPSAIAVTLPTVSRTSLGAANATAGTTPWSVAVSGCGATAATMNTYFEPGSTINASGRLINAGTATNVDGQILTSAFAPVTLGAAPGSQGTTAVAVASGSATQQFYVRYFATAAATAGTFTSSFTFSVIYT